MEDKSKAIVTGFLVAGIILVAKFIPAEVVIKDIFVALLSAIWVLPPVAKMLNLND
jgi:hypothetical protein